MQSVAVPCHNSPTPHPLQLGTGPLQSLPAPFPELCPCGASAGWQGEDCHDCSIPTKSPSCHQRGCQ